jgi:general secretion pathway protein M
MSPIRSLGGRYDWRAAAAVLLYAGLVMILVLAAGGTVMDLLAQRTAVAEASEILDRLQGRRATPGEAGVPANLPAGSPLLEGPTVTVAGAALMQRVSSAVARAHGRIMSSRVELHNSEFGAGFLGVTTSFEIVQPELQTLLYDLEAGMPFLFVDQLVAQSSATTSADSQDGRLQVLLTVYGQWQGAR